MENALKIKNLIESNGFQIIKVFKLGNKFMAEITNGFITKFVNLSLNEKDFVKLEEILNG